MITNYIYNKININIKAGNKTFSTRQFLEEGKCLGVYFVPFNKEYPQCECSLLVQDPQGGDIITSTDYRDYIHKGGGYLQGMKPLDFPTKHNQFSVTATLEKEQASDFCGQLVFMIERVSNNQ